MIPLSLRGLRKSYDAGTTVLAGIDLDIAAGELFFLLGGSGCGKTTLLRLVAGFIAADAGSIRFGDQDVTHVPVERRDLGMVFQNYALWPHLSVAENVAFGLEMRNVPVPERTRRVDEALALVELTGHGPRRIAELSGGQQQRVALARAIVVRPRVLLLDEPLSNLDTRLRQSMRVEIRRICKAAGVTALYVTHDRQEALSTADRIAVMAGGRLAQVGTPREVYERPANRTVALFMGEANLLPATVHGRDVVHCALGTLPARVPADLTAGEAVVVCLRPERIRLGAQGGIAGTITAQTYLGDSAVWQLRGDGFELQVSEPAPPPRAVGDQVGLSVDAGDVVVLRP
jgi:ABC-type Fe3+/spermidine/putrescine transport system ATPase subunit